MSTSTTSNTTSTTTTHVFGQAANAQGGITFQMDGNGQLVVDNEGGRIKDVTIYLDIGCSLATNHPIWLSATLLILVASDRQRQLLTLHVGFQALCPKTSTSSSRTASSRPWRMQTSTHSSINNNITNKCINNNILHNHIPCSTGLRDYPSEVALLYKLYLAVFY